MKNKVMYRVFALLAFITSFVTYAMTVQPGVPFWDCGEFTSGAIWQQVPHPPGAPLFLLVGKLFQMLIPFGDWGWRVNMLSVTASAITIFLLYLITVKVILNFRKDDFQTMSEELAVYGSAFIGALAFAFSDSFWFNAVESEVYASSSFMVAIIVYLMMRWNEQADKPGHERYLLLIAYLVGLSSGVHLLSLLTIFSIVMLAYFRKYEVTTKSFIYMGIIAVVIFFIIYPGIINWFPSALGGMFPYKNKCKEAVLTDSTFVTFMAILIVAAVGVAFWYALKNDKPILKLATSAFLLMLIGYTTYTQVLIRSNANSPMNENEPKTLKGLTSYLGREQYGDAPNWPRRYQTEDYFINNYNKKDKNGEFVYGEWIQPERVDVTCKDPTKKYSLPEFTNVNTAGELNYMLKYQIYHMYIRYFLWNFMGRQSDIQDSDTAFLDKTEADVINFRSGYSHLFPIRFFALPLLFGLFGLFFHFWRDPKMALVYLVMFLLMGILATLQQNQQEPQPRERDYFYAGSFMVFAMWIGMGAYFFIDWLSKQQKPKMLVTATVLLVSLIAVPVNMAAGGWKMHSRAGNYIPFDYSYNILQSTEQDAILFTNGDNDTFPVWFLQDVEGVRRDVRVVNLSLGNTLWYVDQLKNRSPWGAKKLPLTFSDESLRMNENDEGALSYDFEEAKQITIPVDPAIFAKYTNDPELLKTSQMQFTFTGKPYAKRDNKQFYLIRVQDKLVLEILKEVKFKRPVYFSTTVGEDAFCGLERYFRNEGMVMRICPTPQRTSSMDAVDENVMKATLLNVDNSDNYSKTPKYGFKLRNLNNSNVFYDEVHRRLMVNYRSLYVNYAAYYLTGKKDKPAACAVLDTLNKYISPVQFPMSYDLEYRMSRLYKEAGGLAQAKKFADLCIASCNTIIENKNLYPDIKFYEVTGRYMGPYRVLATMYETVDNYPGAREALQKLLALVEQNLDAARGGNQEDIQRMLGTKYDILANLDEYSIADLALKGKKQEAINLANSLIKKYTESTDPGYRYMVPYIEKRLKELTGESSKDTILSDLVD